MTALTALATLSALALSASRATRSAGSARSGHHFVELLLLLGGDAESLLDVRIEGCHHSGKLDANLAESLELRRGQDLLNALVLLGSLSLHGLEVRRTALATLDALALPGLATLATLSALTACGSALSTGATWAALGPEGGELLLLSVVDAQVLLHIGSLHEHG